MLVVIATYPLFSFTEWVYDMHRRLEVGWVMLGCILFNIVFNIALLLIQLVIQSCRKLKFWIIRKKAKREQLRKKAEKEL